MSDPGPLFAKEVVSTALGPVLIDKSGVTYLLVKTEEGGPAWMQIPVAVPKAKEEKPLIQPVRAALSN